MLMLVFTSLLAMASMAESSLNELQTRHRRQTSYKVYYLCGKAPNQYLSLYPCTQCKTCDAPSCSRRCRTTMECQTIDINLACVNGCCQRRNNYPPVTTTTTRAPQPNPLCDGREASAGYCRAGGVCASGFTCTGNNVCCRCAYGTSIGPCVNQQCPDNFQCNINNECCPYQVG